jgi:hypothetical protein
MHAGRALLVKNPPSLTPTTRGRQPLPIPDPNVARMLNQSGALQRAAMKETVRLLATFSSWRGSFEDLAEDIEFATELVRRRASGRPLVSTFTLTLGARTREYATAQELLSGLRTAEYVTEIEISLRRDPTLLALTLSSDDGLRVVVHGEPVDRPRHAERDAAISRT